ncbi:MAG TPA: CDP-alcohol phosphatidyltransferase family protein [Vicinamibacterales bacterium]|nr:CDP-alcohol phosphatidyltransferase family protein [Vicinamibacterales bacterium]
MSGSPLAAFHRANALTYASLVSAIGAISAAFHGSAAVAGALIAVSVMADTFDGKFARLFHRTSEERAFGVQLDSLSDAIAFGAAPCVCMMLLAPPGAGSIRFAWWTAFAAFAACAITRLAFYNVTQAESRGFVGLPAPVAALVWSSVLLLDPGATTSAGVLLGAAAAMVLPVPIPRPAGISLALFTAWPLLVIVAHVARG